MHLHPALVGAALLLVLLGAMLARHRLRVLRIKATELARRIQAQDADRRALLVQMHDARHSAERADRAKTRFLAAASHDLRQPAHALGLYLAALREGPLAPGQAELTARMAQALQAQDELLAGLLDISRLDAEEVQPRWEVVALAPLLRRLADEWDAPAQARGLRLALHLGPAAGAATTVTDAPLLERVLRNLLANAVRHTSQGGLLLACRLRTPHEGDAAWRVEVWDTGAGIAPADQERIFEEFVQLAPSRGGAAGGGLGLGLAIARRLALLLHVRLGLASRPGRGSVFWVDGLAPAGPAPRAADAARRQGRRLAGLRVAVIDDDAAVRDAMARLLRQWDCEPVCGADASEVLRAVEAVPGPALAAVVADLSLADGRDGPQEARRLLEGLGLEVPVLLVTGETAPARLAQATASGLPCLTKPVSPARLRSWLEQVAIPHPAGADEDPGMQHRTS